MDAEIVDFVISLLDNNVYFLDAQLSFIYVERNKYSHLLPRIERHICSDS